MVRFPRIRAGHLALLLLGVMLAIPSLFYPFGRDQSLYHYVAREWLHGRFPYRDSFDQKPPLIYVLHALSIVLFGEGQWGIRLLELFAVIATGWAATRLVEGPEAERPMPAGPGVVVAAVLYYVHFDYWDTAQIELWEGLFVLATLLGAQRIRKLSRACVCTGALFGCAVLLKFPAAVFLPLVALVLLARVRRNGEIVGLRGLAKVVGWTAGAMAAPVLLTIIVFFASGALFDLYDVLIGYNRYYALNKRSANWSPFFHFLFGNFLIPVVLSVGAALVSWAHARQSGRRILPGLWIGVLGWALAILSVISQGKFYGYHWGVLLPFATLTLVVGLHRMQTRPAWVMGLTLAFVSYSLLAGPSWNSNSKVSYATYVGSLGKRLSGTWGEPQFLSQFIGGYGYSYRALADIGAEIKRQARPGDQLHVHGFEPIPYTISGLRSPSRFFAEFPLIDPALAYRRQEWLSEHVRALTQDPPRFVVDFRSETARIVRRLREGYAIIMRSGQFVLLGRP